MQTKTSQRESSRTDQRAVQKQSASTAQRKPDPLGSAGMLLSLQRSHGNRYVQRLLNKTLIQRDCGCGGTCVDCSPKQQQSDQDHHSALDGLHRHSAGSPATSSVPSVVHEVLSSAGQPLDASARAFMEPRFGRDFNSVRIHTGTKASDSAKAVSALAYTVGQDIVFAEGQYRPASQEGQRLLAHELAHTVQQAGASPGPISGISQPGDASEREAEQVANRVMRMEQPSSTSDGLNNRNEPPQDRGANQFPASTILREGDDQQPADTQAEDEGYEVGDEVIMLRPRLSIATLPQASSAQSNALARRSDSEPMLQRAGCDTPSTMRKITSGSFEGGKTLDDYYPDLVGTKAWGTAGTAGPFDNGARAGSAVQLIADYPSPCTARGSGFTFSQSASTVRFRINGKKVMENGKAFEGTTFDDYARAGRDQSTAPFRQGFSFAVSVADPISGAPYAGLDSYEFEVNLTTSVSGGGETKSVNWGVTIEAAKGKVTKNEVR